MTIKFFKPQSGIARPTAAGFVMLLAVVVTGAWSGFSWAKSLIIHHQLENQLISVTFPPAMQTRTRTTQPLEIRLDGVINTIVPVEQLLSVPLKGQYKTRFRIDAEIPLDLLLKVDTTIPVDVVADVDIDVDFDFQQVKRYRGVPVKAKVPVRQDIPLSVSVPIRHALKLTFEGPLDVAIDHDFTAPIDQRMTINATVDQVVTAPITSSFGMNVKAEQVPIRAVIDQAQLKIVPIATRLGL